MKWLEQYKARLKERQIEMQRGKMHQGEHEQTENEENTAEEKYLLHAGVEATPAELKGAYDDLMRRMVRMCEDEKRAELAKLREEAEEDKKKWRAEWEQQKKMEINELKAGFKKEQEETRTMFGKEILRLRQAITEGRLVNEKEEEGFPHWDPWSSSSTEFEATLASMKNNWEAGMARLRK